MPDLAVIIVTWNVRDLALNALASLLADVQTNRLADAQVYVVDNASTDSTAQAIRTAFPEVHVTASDKNLGFGAANNLALREIGAPRAPVGVDTEAVRAARGSSLKSGSRTGS